MSTRSSVPPFVDGSEEANGLLSAVFAGTVSLEDARRWIAELRREGLTQLAREVECRLPRRH